MQENLVNQMMYINALHGLENGCLMPWDKEILASNPLPSTVIEPYTTKEVPNVLESMNITFSAMSVWIEEAKKVNYFSKRFVQLSKMVMNGVTTMGRGLVTLHQRGEDLSQAPMSIQDLLGVASYHFRKSYLGVLQTSRSHPEIGERLLMNQIGWNNMLMRLFKTRDKLKQASGVVNEDGRMKNEEKGPGAGGQRQENSECGIRNEELASGAVQSSNSGIAAGTMTLPASSERAFSAPAAYAEQGAFGVPRAFSSFDKKARNNGTRSLKHGQTNGNSVTGKTISGGSVNENRKSDGLTSGKKMNETPEPIDVGTQEAEITAAENEGKSEGKQQFRENEAERIITGSGTVNGDELQIRENDQDPEDGVIVKENLSGTDNETKSDLPSEPLSWQPPDDGGGTVKAEPRTGELCSSEKNGGGKIGDCPVKAESPAGEISSSGKIGDSPIKGQSLGMSPEDQSGRNGDSPVKGQSPGMSPEDQSGRNGDSPVKGQFPDMPPEDQFPKSELPPYLQILQKVFARSGPSENGEVTFTFDEIHYLACDPDFNRIYPDQVAKMRSILQNMDSS